MRTSSTLLRGQQDLGSLIAAVVDLQERDVGRTARGQAVVGLIRFNVGVQHVAVDAVAAEGAWERLASTPGTSPIDPVRITLEAGGRRVGRLELEGRQLRRTQRTAINAIAPLLARALSLAAHDIRDSQGAVALPVMATERATARYALTPREAEVLTAVASGATNRSIAEGLGCTEGTLEHHVRALLRKMDCRNRGELIAMVWSRVARP